MNSKKTVEGAGFSVKMCVGRWGKMLATIGIRVGNQRTTCRRKRQGRGRRWKLWLLLMLLLMPINRDADGSQETDHDTGNMFFLAICGRGELEQSIVPQTGTPR